MSKPDLSAQALQFLREEFENEWKSGFALLRQIPSTSVRKSIDYFLGLNVADQKDLAAALSMKALQSIFPTEAPHPLEEKNVAFQRFREALPVMWDWKYMSTRDLRSGLKAAESDPCSSMAELMTNEVKTWVRTIKPVKSTEIRKMAKLGLSQIISSMTTSHEPYRDHCWNHCGSLAEIPVCVRIDTASRFRTFDYSVVRPEQHRNAPFIGLNYEMLLGLSGSDWDCIQQSNLDGSTALLKELVVRCAFALDTLPVVLKPIPDE